MEPKKYEMIIFQLPLQPYTIYSMIVEVKPMYRWKRSESPIRNAIDTAFLKGELTAFIYCTCDSKDVITELWNTELYDDPTLAGKLVQTNDGFIIDGHNFTVEDIRELEYGWRGEIKLTLYKGNWERK